MCKTIEPFGWTGDYDCVQKTITEYTANVLINFRYEHLPPHLQAASKPFCEAAIDVAVTLPEGPEKTKALGKLLEAKDAAVRAVVNAGKDALVECQAMINARYQWDEFANRWARKPDPKPPAIGYTGNKA
jgi:hypothetical protein